MMRSGLILLGAFVGLVLLCTYSTELCTFVAGMENDR